MKRENINGDVPTEGHLYALDFQCLTHVCSLISTAMVVALIQKECEPTFADDRLRATRPIHIAVNRTLVRYELVGAGLKGQIAKHSADVETGES